MISPNTLSAIPETAMGRAKLGEFREEVIDGADLVGLAEEELLKPLDERARAIVLDAAKRVSLVTAVSPRALVDVGYVIFESGRLIRRISELYGGRPGTIGFYRLTRDVLSHLAVTGSIAVGESLVQQLIGHGLAGARFGASRGRRGQWSDDGANWHRSDRNGTALAVSQNETARNG